MGIILDDEEVSAKMMGDGRWAKMLPRGLGASGASVHRRRGGTWPTGMARAKRRVGNR